MTKLKHPTKEQYRGLADEILQNFNFHKVLKMMTAVDWMCGDRAVTLDDIKACAERQLQTLLDDKRVTSSFSGGFTASRHRGELGLIYLQLEFVGERWNTE